MKVGTDKGVLTLSIRAADVIALCSPALQFPGADAPPSRHLKPVGKLFFSNAINPAPLIWTPVLLGIDLSPQTEIEDD